MNIKTTTNPKYGFKVSFYEDDKWIGQHTQKNGIEIGETELFKSIITDNTLVFDVGANLGWYSLVFAQTLKENNWTGLSVAFEPESTNFNLLSQNITQNDFDKYTKLEKIGIGNEYISNAKIWLSLLNGEYINRGDHRFNQGTREHFEEVDIYTLDQYIKETMGDDIYHYNNFILKVDVQGYEFKVLQGATEFLNNVSPVHLLIEFNRGTGVEHFNFIKDHFGKIQILGGGEATSFEDIVDFCETKKHTHANLYAVKL